MELTATSRRTLLDLARRVIRAELASAMELIAPSDPVMADPALNLPAGAFVSLHELTTHRLRGCVGRLDATSPLFRATAAAAKSVLSDPRFTDRRVTTAELANLEIEITVTWPLQPAADALDFDLLNDGIYLTLVGRSGCFLPQVARDTGWDKPTLLDRLCTEKIGVPAGSWKQPEAKMQKFNTLLIGPERFQSAES